eukprot:1074319-Pelagomonas_calceolata.AAC.6
MLNLPLKDGQKIHRNKVPIIENTSFKYVLPLLGCSKPWANLRTCVSNTLVMIVLISEGKHDYSISESSAFAPKNIKGNKREQGLLRPKTRDGISS